MQQAKLSLLIKILLSTRKAAYRKLVKKKLILNIAKTMTMFQEFLYWLSIICFRQRLKDCVWSVLLYNNSNAILQKALSSPSFGSPYYLYERKSHCEKENILKQKSNSFENTLIFIFINTCCLHVTSHRFNEEDNLCLQIKLF